MPPLLSLFVGLRLAQQAVEAGLARLNRRHATDPARLAEAGGVLGIAPDEMAKAIDYSGDRHRLGLAYGWAEAVVLVVFVALGGLGVVEAAARRAAASVDPGPIATGLAFFAVLGLLGSLFELPFDLYSTFRVEERHGFNHQTLRGFLADRRKGLAIAVVLGGPALAAVLWAMERTGPSWWLWAWGITTAFSVLVAWIYPTVLAPLFNRFSDLPEGELRDEILALARRTGFRAAGISVMDASRRTAHGNAYFTGVFGHKRIVLFDTLLEAMGTREVVAVLAHEIGHSRLHHVRWGILRGVAASGLLFFILSRCLPVEAFYSAFALDRTAYGALAVFGLWLGPASFLLQPIGTAISRRHELAADAFALRSGASAADLGSALLKLRGKSRLLPVAHPLYSAVYHSHPPLLERLRAMGGPART